MDIFKKLAMKEFYYVLQFKGTFSIYRSYLAKKEKYIYIQQVNLFFDNWLLRYLLIISFLRCF